MELSELTAYAEGKYNIKEEHKWADFPGFSVLRHPETGKWMALLMRQWDSDSGTQIERCDLKCGRGVLYYDPRSYLTYPLRMHGNQWIGVEFNKNTENRIVYQLFDAAIKVGKPHGYLVELAGHQASGGNVYKETALPSFVRPLKEHVPEKIRQMRHLYEYGRESAESQAENFYRQAIFMKDYEDDAPWPDDLICYFPTYQKLSTAQLRGYFAWRGKIRAGDFRHAAPSLAYIYIYEILNGIGTETPEDVIAKLNEFEEGYVDAGFGGDGMKKNIMRWKLEYAVLKGLSADIVEKAAEPEMVAADKAVYILSKPREHTDKEVTEALLIFAPKRYADSPVLKKDPERGVRLLSEAWKTAMEYERKGKKLFELCFGEKITKIWHPFSNVVYYDRERPADRVYELNESRSYFCKKGIWYVSSYEQLYFDKLIFQGFLHEADALLRRYLKTGRYLKEKPIDNWADPYINSVIEAERKELEEAARPKININLEGLERIRQDAEVTKERLLTEEELEGAGESFEAAGEEPEEQPMMPEAETQAKALEQENSAELPCDNVQLKILKTLLEGKDAGDTIRENHLMPSIAADMINEAFFEEIGDTVVTCDDDRLTLVEDYKEELEELLGGSIRG